MLKFSTNDRLLEFAATHLVCHGVLCQQPDGYLYLKISDDFIHRLFQFVEEPAKRMPDYFSATKNAGAHISLVYPNEVTRICPHPLLGKTFSFKLGRYFSAEIQHKTYFGCLVEAAQLQKIRSDLGLDVQLNFKGTWVPLHLTIAVNK